ncbi:sulfatase-like hydrolase/transferase, partial [Pelobium sp.]
ALSENGYEVGYTGKGWAPGIALKSDGSPRDLLVNFFDKRKLDPLTSKMSREDYAANFQDFLAQKPANKPFFFWYGGREPHRPYEYGSSINKNHKKLSDMYDIYPLWPKNDTVTTDLLDYAFEVEYFDAQLQKMIDILKQNGQLDNTIIIVTSDNGMPFPRIKGQEYELSNHLPLAIMWPKGIKYKGRKIKDYMSFVDLAPTLLECAGVNAKSSGMSAITGQSFAQLFESKSDQNILNKDYVLIGKERHDIGRPKNEGYPIRGIFKGDFLYLRNYKPDRWPAGNPETGYLNTDGGATKTVVLNTWHTSQNYFWQLNFGKRANEELYDINKDPFCINNLASNPAFASIKSKMSTQMTTELLKQGDLRMMGKGDVYESYSIYPLNHNNYYENYMSGKFKEPLSWVNPSDYRPEQSEK